MTSHNKAARLRGARSWFSTIVANARRSQIRRIEQLRQVTATQFVLLSLRVRGGCCLYPACRFCLQYVRVTRRRRPATATGLACATFQDNRAPYPDSHLSRSDLIRIAHGRAGVCMRKGRTRRSCWQRLRARQVLSSGDTGKHESTGTPLPFLDALMPAPLAAYL